MTFEKAHPDAAKKAVRLRRELMRAMARDDTERAIELAKELEVFNELKAEHERLSFDPLDR